MRRCPACARPNSDHASRCLYCDQELPPAGPEAAPVQLPPTLPGAAEGPPQRAAAQAGCWKVLGGLGLLGCMSLPLASLSVLVIWHMAVGSVNSGRDEIRGAEPRPAQAPERDGASAPAGQLPSGGGGPHEGPRETGGPWSSRSWLDPKTGRENFSIQVTSQAPYKSWLGEESATLTLGCRGTRGELWLDIGDDFAASDGDDNTASLELRVDEQAPLVVRAQRSADGDSAFLPDPLARADALGSGAWLAVAFHPADAEAAVVRFSLEGYDPHLAWLRERCGW